MNHIVIKQDTTGTEEVSYPVIVALYNAVTDEYLDNTSELLGRLHCTGASKAKVDYLTETFSNLYITADSYFIDFEDENMKSYLLSLGIGSNGEIGTSDAAAATVVANSVNTIVTKFNELKYFTGITESLGGLSGTSSGAIMFSGWTALEEIDISNFTSIGRAHNAAYLDSFYNCTALKTVTASNKLRTLGTNAFCECSNLESITGLSGTISIGSNALKNCSKLSDSVIENISFLPLIGSSGLLLGSSAFYDTNFSEITMSSNTTTLPPLIFYNCLNLETVNGIENVTDFLGQCFLSCSKFTGPIDFTNVTHIGGSAFANSALTGTVDLQSILIIDIGNNFSNTKITSVNFNGKNLSYNGSFSGCKQLTTATGMYNITTISSGMFLGCSGLTSVDFDWDNKVIDIGNNAFRDCTGLLQYSGNTVLGGISIFDGCINMEWPQQVTLTTDPGHRSFYNCKLNKIVLGNNVTSLYNTCFCNCSQLTEISGLENILYIGDYIFEGCTSLSGVIDLSGVLGVTSSNNTKSNRQPVYVQNTFKDCHSITKVIIGTLPYIEVTNLYTPFRNNYLLKVVDITSLDHITVANGRSLFTYCTVLHSFILRSQTVVPLYAPSGDNSTFEINRICENKAFKVYVPDNLVNDYKQSSKWVDISNYIYPISQFAIDHPDEVNS